MKETRETIVYKNAGEDYLGREPIKPLKFWIEKGRELGQQFMYKGFHWFDGKSDQVVVYSQERFDAVEIDRRIKNGLLGIREYIL